VLGVYQVIDIALGNLKLAGQPSVFFGRENFRHARPDEIPQPAPADAPPTLQLREHAHYERNDGKIVGNGIYSRDGFQMSWWFGADAYTDDGKHKGGRSELDLRKEVAPPQSEPQPDSEGWIPWAGGECPVAPTIRRVTPAPKQYRPFASADDDEPITEEWLSSVGFKQNKPSHVWGTPNCNWHHGELDLEIWQFNDTDKWLWVECDGVPMRTRESLKLLMRWKALQ
jgi:hypothetical protein